MNKVRVCGVGVISAATVFIGGFGAGTAVAVDEFNGSTYAKAMESVNSWGGTLIVATREGSYLPTGECLIVGTRKASSLDSSGNQRHKGGTYLVDLNCFEKSAAYGHPGNSLASPKGKEVQEWRSQAQYYSYEYTQSVAAGKEPKCSKSFNWCQRICREAKNCSADLLDFLEM